MKGCSKSSALALNYCSLALRHRCQVYNNTLIGNYGIYTADGWEIAKLSINYYWKLLSLYATLFISNKISIQDFKFRIDQGPQGHNQSVKNIRTLHT